jgi:hypothetical protein
MLAIYLLQGRYDEAISILERVQDFDSIEDLNRRRLSTPMPELGSELIRFRRSVVKERGEWVLATEIEGRTISDRKLATMGKKELVERYGWALAPLLWGIHNEFIDRGPVKGDLIYSKRTKKIRPAQQVSEERNERYRVLERVPVITSMGKLWATRLDGMLVLDDELRNTPKMELVRRYGWSVISVLARVSGMGLKLRGFYILDTLRGTVHRLVRLEKVA